MFAKGFLLAVILGIALAAPLTPASRMSNSFDNLVFNMATEYEMKGLG